MTAAFALILMLAAAEPTGLRPAATVAPAAKSSSHHSAHHRRHAARKTKGAQAVAPSGAPTPPPGPAVATDEDLDLPPSAPRDDYGFVAWCEGALSGHMALFPLVKPQMKAMEHDGEAKDNAELDQQQLAAGREYLDLYRQALTASDAASNGAQHPRADQARAEGDHLWAAARAADPQTRMWSWIMWELPPHCEIAAHRLLAGADALGAALKHRPAATSSPEKHP